jgi:hypothetical protein
LFASQGIRFKEAGLRYGSRFPISPATFMSDDEEEYTRGAAIDQKNRQSAEKLSTADAQAVGAASVGRCINRWTDWCANRRKGILEIFSPG